MHLTFHWLLHGGMSAQVLILVFCHDLCFQFNSHLLPIWWRTHSHIVNVICSLRWQRWKLISFNRIHVESHPVYNGWLDGNCLDALARGDYILDASVIDTLTWHLTLHASACFTIFLVRLPWQENSSTKHLSRHTWIFWLFGVSGLACKTNHCQKNHLPNLVQQACESQAGVS